jgi:hypothetical protein
VLLLLLPSIQLGAIGRKAERMTLDANAKSHLSSKAIRE